MFNTNNKSIEIKVFFHYLFIYEILWAWIVFFVHERSEAEGELYFASEDPSDEPMLDWMRVVMAKDSLQIS